ncbi:hypothetical protein LCGC14_0163890 [marine sediment metagenome]|uniref:Uncharacterized protein n=1 Tax=marine sediment metagenome TaxID=412755 RepID=A0A0F9UUH7_9ZZZZ
MTDSNNYRDCAFCNEVVAYGAAQHLDETGKLYHVDCLIKEKDAEIDRLKKILATIEEGGEKYFASHQDQVEHLQALAYRAHTPEPT